MPSPTRTIELILQTMRQRFSSDPTERFVFEDPCVKRFLINSDLDPASFTQAAQRLLAAANLDWISTGTNMTTALSTLAPDGGIVQTTATANNDQALLTPSLLNSIYITAIGGTSGSAGTSPWTVAGNSFMEAIVSLSSVAAVRFIMGFKLTSTPTLATDNDQAFLKFDTAGSVSTTRFTCVTSVGGTDTEAVERTGKFTAAAATNYRLSVEIKDRIPIYRINGEIVGTGPTLATPMALIPVIGIQTLTTAAKAFTVRRIRLERDVA